MAAADAPPPESPRGDEAAALPALVAATGLAEGVLARALGLAEGSAALARALAALGAAAALLGARFQAARVCPSHGLEHARAVMRHVLRALAAGPAPEAPRERLACALAGLGHDGDDRKSFPGHADDENVRAALAAADCADVEAAVLRMVRLVSASKNHDAVPAECAGGRRPWLLYPRWADRLEALGWVGAWRCGKYTQTIGRPFWTAETARARSPEELGRLVTADRYAAYAGASASMIDHYYDKLLHIGREPAGNAYLDAELGRRRGVLEQIALDFGRDGFVRSDFVEHARGRAESETAAEAGAGLARD